MTNHKRRRTDDYDQTTWQDSALLSQTIGQPTFSALQIRADSNSGPEKSRTDFGETTTCISGDASASSALNNNAQWTSGASSYPDVASYSQPYFYQQTDPSIYTSPWPPVQSNIYSHSNNTGLNTDVATNMPLFPTSSGIESMPNDPTTTDMQDVLQNDSLVQYSYGDAQSGDTSAANGPFYLEDASMHLKLQSVSILDDLATQLIQTIAKANYAHIQDLMTGTDTEEGQAYTTLKSFFDQTRKVYSRETAFIDALAIQMFQPSQQESIRKANIATFISSILGAHDVSFFHLNEYFMETFVPSGHRLLKWQGAIYLEMKTQTYISALMNSDGKPDAMLDELFPNDLDALILTRHPDAPSLSPSEQDFIDRCRARKNYLLAEPIEEAVRELPRKYQWSDFVREFASCICKNVDGIMNLPARSQGGVSKANGHGHGHGHDTLVGAQGLKGSSHRAVGASAAPPSLPHQTSSNNEKRTTTTTTSSTTTTTSSSTTRQPWTKPEESALLTGLTQVSGPHWSQILALYGRGGSVSEVLKDRNQVQLKDKARNLKLWYLKMGREVPVALRGVTGELWKRGGARIRAAMGEGGEDEVQGDEREGEGMAEGENVDPSLGLAGAVGKGRRKKGRK
ncbi:TTAGGG repeat binding factor [Recurvomyces mirabilis]|uniref:TTAGGG repeat binding factor n=1 Tax=Recurvomyces mirabilis TaxID=574656 RepID=A0AAE1C4R1_9PEZI|nr:TTAGGG repeat binding factor [Recurvomyces mirabilis]KAK5160498.1 TTAGGG repeat binding factor [Recurvomyces mirabilis]